MTDEMKPSGRLAITALVDSEVGKNHRRFFWRGLMAGRIAQALPEDWDIDLAAMREASREGGDVAADAEWDRLDDKTRTFLDRYIMEELLPLYTRAANEAVGAAVVVGFPLERIDPNTVALYAQADFEPEENDVEDEEAR